MSRIAHWLDAGSYLEVRYLNGPMTLKDSGLDIIVFERD